MVRLRVDYSRAHRAPPTPRGLAEVFDYENTFRRAPARERTRRRPTAAPCRKLSLPHFPVLFTAPAKIADVDAEWITPQRFLAHVPRAALIDLHERTHLEALFALAAAAFVHGFDP